MGGVQVTRYELTKAEEGTPRVADLLAVGWEPFAMISEPWQDGHYREADGTPVPVFRYSNVIWFRRVLA